jgi:hypothetical protein
VIGNHQFAAIGEDALDLRVVANRVLGDGDLFRAIVDIFAPREDV